MRTYITRMHAGYELRSSGYCAAYITSIDECNKAAAVLSLKATAASTVTGPKYPPGCSYGIHNNLRSNTAGRSADVSRRTCSTFHECLCKVTKTRSPTISSPTTTGTPSMAPTLTPTIQLQAPSTAELLVRCNTMMNTTFSEADITEVDIEHIGRHSATQCLQCAFICSLLF